MQVKPYLENSMLKRLLACLALISGLAAVGAPAHASVSDALGAALELSQKADQPGKAWHQRKEHELQHLEAQHDELQPDDEQAFILMPYPC